MSAEFLKQGLFTPSMRADHPMKCSQKAHSCGGGANVEPCKLSLMQRISQELHGDPLSRLRRKQTENAVAKGKQGHYLNDY
jgi:hypothetical protein